MPIDDLQCTDDACKGGIKDFERPHCMNGEDLPPCPECGKKMQVNWSAKRGNFSLKGGGWFKDGYSKGGPK